MPARKRRPWVRVRERAECWLPKCRRPLEPGDRAVLMTTGTRYEPMHAYHAKWVNLAVRLRLLRSSPPGVAATHADRSSGVTMWAAYNWSLNLVLLPPMFGYLTPASMGYALGHEAVHWVLSREFGLVASVQFDGLYQRPLRCLGDISLFERELRRIAKV